MGNCPVRPKFKVTLSIISVATGFLLLEYLDTSRIVALYIVTYTGSYHGYSKYIVNFSLTNELVVQVVVWTVTLQITTEYQAFRAGIGDCRSG